MCNDITIQKNVFLDQILADRRSHRRFRPEFCSGEDIRRILHAGLLAPFAAAAVGGSHEYFRRFFILRRGSESMNAAVPLVLRQVKNMSAELETAMQKDPSLRLKAEGLSGGLPKSTIPALSPVSALRHFLSWLLNAGDTLPLQHHRWHIVSRTCG